MTAGAFLDEATAMLRLALTRLDAVDVPSGYDVTATVAARNDVYLQLLRMLGLVTNDSKDRGAHDPDLRIGVATRWISTAVLDIPRLPSGLLRAPGTIAEAVAEAAQALGMAADIIATHRRPAPDVGERRGGRGRSYLTSEGFAIARGAQRWQAVGEVVRIAATAHEIDCRLLGWRAFHPDALNPELWLRLESWINHHFRGVLAKASRVPKATLLRQLGPAPAAENTDRICEVLSWPDVPLVVQRVRSAVRRSPQLATIALADATARLGFAAAAAEWRVAGERGPTGDVIAEGEAWRTLSQALKSLADLRDKSSMPLAMQLDHAKDWIRKAVTGSVVQDGLAPRLAVANVQVQVRLLCAELLPLLRKAADRRILLSADVKLGHETAGGVRRATTVWSPAGPADSALSSALNSLQAVAGIVPRQATGISAAFPGTVTRMVRAQSTGTRRALAMRRARSHAVER